MEIRTGWLILIFAVLVMILVFVIRINGDIEQQALSERQKVTLQRETEAKEKVRIMEAEMREENRKLKELPFTSVPSELIPVWLKLTLDDYHPFAFLGFLTLIYWLLYTSPNGYLFNARHSRLYFANYA